MPVVRSFGQVENLAPRYGSSGLSSASGGAVRMYDHTATYREIYRRQPSVRTCIDFLSRNFAQVGFGVFKAVSETDRKRLRSHQLARWMKNPARSTRYRLMSSTAKDYFIYDRAYWLKIRTGPKEIRLLRLPPYEVKSVPECSLFPTGYQWTPTGATKPLDLPASEVVAFEGYEDGCSVLETLRRTLAEEYAAALHRESFWRNAARMEGVVSVEASGPRYTPTQIREFATVFTETQGGSANSGKTAFLGTGMRYTPTSFSAKDSEYVSSRKLNLEEIARLYHIPLPLIGILEHATFSNIRAQHEHLYQDCLGPTFQDFKETIERYLLPDCDDTVDVYGEFNIEAKMRGSFEEQQNSIRSAVGGPTMTLNEGRAKQNLPRVDQPGSDNVQVALNMNANGDQNVSDQADQATGMQRQAPPADDGSGDDE